MQKLAGGKRSDAQGAGAPNHRAGAPKITARIQISLLPKDDKTFIQNPYCQDATRKGPDLEMIPPRAKPEAFGHHPALDALRATAILIVMASHAGLERFVPGGFGVTVFFFLSGYLITSLLRLEAAGSKIDLRNFYLRRTVRIIPPMVITIIATNILMWATGSPAASVISILSDLAFLTNYNAFTHIPASVPIPLWSLDVEEHFYILFSTLYAAVLVRFSARDSAKICFSLCAVILAVRLLYAFRTDELANIYYWSHTRIDSIMFGCALALWRNPIIDPDPIPPSRIGVVAAAAALLACLLIRDEIFRQTLRYTIQGIALIFVFSWALQCEGRWRRIFTLAPVRWIALLSYTLYLSHFQLLTLFKERGLPFAWLWAYAGAVIYATAMYQLVERPLGRWRRRVERRPIAVQSRS
jgi:peptidoglycan/LPS O-acetylase OafA/YrhL